MAAYYLDSSALVKRYAAETGTFWVRSVTSPANGHVLFVALVAGAEVVAAVAKREQMRSLSAKDAQQAISDLPNYLRAHYRVDEGHCRRCHGACATIVSAWVRLGTLAIALTINDEPTPSGCAAITSVSAEADLNTKLSAWPARSFLTKCRTCATSLGKP